MKLERSLVERTVALVSARDASARLVGIRGDAGWTGDAEVTIGQERWRLAPCRTRLEVSTRLVRAGEDRVVLVTPLKDAELGLDVLARLARGKVHEVSPWELVRARFAAHQIDPRVMRLPWLAEVLLAADDGVLAAPGGYLDEATAWRAALEQVLDLDTGIPDAVALMRWSLDDDRAARFAAVSSEERRSGLAQRLRDTLGSIGTPLVAAMVAGHARELLPLGLACEVLFPDPPAKRRPETLKQAVVRLETWLGGHTLTASEGAAWRRAATTVLDRLPEAESAEALRRAEDWLGTLKVADKALGQSALFRGGLERRFAGFGEALTTALGGAGDIADVEASFAELEAHREATRHADAIDRLRMALRALRWLRTDLALPETLAAAVSRHGTDTAFADRARRHLLGAESPQALADGVRTLRDALQGRRDALNERFARLLAQWSAAPTATDAPLPVERFLDEVVCRLPPKRRALVIVLDGMDGGTFSELAEDLEGKGWIRHAHAETGAGRDGLLAVLPTVTEFSRSALLTGRLGPGDQHREKQGFAAHAGLAARSQGAPSLFHKAKVSDDGAGGLSHAVREAVADGRRGVVGVVINAVDDHLAKSEQLRLRWDVAAFRLLGPLLDAAETASRTVIFTADHGHVLEADAERVVGGDAERWRHTDASAGPGEIEITGPRLSQGAGFDRAVLLWTERARYCRAKAGYHGGATLQEAVVPLAVLTRDVQEMEGWQGLPPATPDWWFAVDRDVVSEPSERMLEQEQAPERASAATARAAAAGQIGLFDDGPAKTRAASPGPVVDEVAPDTVTVPEWIEALLASEVYALQRKAAGRRAPSDAQVVAVLSALDQQGGRLSETRLARALGVPAFRTKTVLAVVADLLSVDGFAVLVVDGGAAEDRTVRLERELLTRQFEIDG